MRSNPTHSVSSARRPSGTAALKSLPRRGPLAKRCRTCDELHPVGALVFGQCPECAGLVALPLRGPGGRFISLTHHSAVTDGGERA
jgi:hypothetical protein